MNSTNRTNDMPAGNDDIWLEGARASERLEQDFKEFRRWVIVTAIFIIVVCCGVGWAIFERLQ